MIATRQILIMFFGLWSYVPFLGGEMTAGLHLSISVISPKGLNKLRFFSSSLDEIYLNQNTLVLQVHGVLRGKPYGILFNMYACTMKKR